ncbi:unnamed protein product [Albugo candida]|uniref:Uncharacterized protein n=1 Tax=Albugo candida TaxID=65357 RepID=A0A024G499_9STRA|nr:unnamed protein product [Albugo candida]|eukprot:CCI41139.1 unnamed protein product [Albugo candida]
MSHFQVIVLSTRKHTITTGKSVTFGHFEVIESLPGMLRRKKTANVTTKMTKHFPFIPMAPSVPNNAPTSSYMTLSERQLYAKFGLRDPNSSTSLIPSSPALHSSTSSCASREFPRLSGCNSSALLRYAFLSNSGVVSIETPSVS